MAAPSVIEQRLIFTVDDPDRRITQLGLDCDDAIAGPRRFRRTSTGWALTIPRPRLNRVEYRLVVTDRSGGTEVVCDPANPERVRTAFGERSVALMPGYERPSWLKDPGPRGTTTQLTHLDPTLGELPIVLWSPRGLTRRKRAPLLVANDGPEYADLADLTTYAASMIERHELPPFRIALMQPVERDEWYAANPDYLGATAAAVGTIAGSVPVSENPVVMGASLGGLSAVLSVLAPGAPFAAAFSQSGSFFQAELDAQESTYPFFDRVVETVDAVRRAEATRARAIAMTCGRLEENFANNELMASVFDSQGHGVAFSPVDDLHNYTGWRDSLDPALTDLLRYVWPASRMRA
jgi:enterochelin esterase-like enzyme